MTTRPSTGSRDRVSQPETDNSRSRSNGSGMSTPPSGRYSSGSSQDRSRGSISTADPGRSRSISSPAGSSRYKSQGTVRSRSGGFDDAKSSIATRDRSAVGRVYMRNGNTRSSDRFIENNGKRYRYYDYAKPDYVRSNYQIVSRYNDGRTVVNRHHLIDYDGRYGHAHNHYSGRNWHFYLTLVNNNFYFGIGYSPWNRRYYGDGWDLRFGWNSGVYLPTGYWNYGTYYFEPCYAFSFTFNHGYEQGYIDGFNQGADDWNRYYPYSSYPRSVYGYQSYYGSYFEYSDGYEQGFQQGYYAGYSGKEYGYMNFGFGDFNQYPVVYDFDYDYYERSDYGYDDGYEYTDEYGRDGYNY